MLPSQRLPVLEGHGWVEGLRNSWNRLAEALVVNRDAAGWVAPISSGLMSTCPG